MKRWIIIGAILTAIGGGIAIAGCTTNPDGSAACDLSGCSYTQNGPTFSCYADGTTGQHTCNECAFGEEVFDCTDSDQWGDCWAACTGTCVGNCIQQNCGDCGAADCSGGCDTPEACEDGYWITRELVEGEDYVVNLLRVDNVTQDYDGTYDIAYTLDYDYFGWSAKFHEIKSTVEVLLDGEVIGTNTSFLTRWDSDQHNPHEVSNVTNTKLAETYSALGSYTLSKSLEIRIVKVVANEYILK